MTIPRIHHLWVVLLLGLACFLAVRFVVVASRTTATATLWDVPQTSTTRRTLATRRLSAAATRSRIVQESFLDDITASSSTEPCVATTAIDYINQVLGPSGASSALYKSVVLENIDSLGNSLPIRIRELAQALLEDDLRNGRTTNGTVFVPENQYFGRYGEHTDELRQQHVVLTEFWGAPEPVLLVGLHSEPLGDNLERAIGAWLVKEGQLTDNEYLQYNVSTDTIQQLAIQVQAALETELPSNYSSPALSYIAYYAPRFGVRAPSVDASASVVVLGDGYLDFYHALGLGVVGADMIHAHEYSHALHFALDLANVDGNLSAYVQNFVSTRSPETDRRYELEADAMGAYALAHPQGLYWNVSLLRQAAQAMYTIGDCQVTQAFHHGTPLQRQCATLWGADEAVQDDDINGTITSRPPLSPREFRNLFDAHLDLILALDPVVCNLTDENGRAIRVPSPPLPPARPTATSRATRVTPWLVTIFALLTSMVV